MPFETNQLFRDDAYLKECQSEVLAINDRGGIILNQTIFYATGGGQPGDSGILVMQNGTEIQIATTVYGETKTEIVHVPSESDILPEIGEMVTCKIDWERRYKHMRMHTALHVVSAVLPYTVTGGQIGSEEGRLDFDIPEPNLDKKHITTEINRLITGNHTAATEWITDEELESNPDLVKTMSVKPPMGTGRVRLLRIGENIDLQACGGTHVNSTEEIGPVIVSKIENKGKQNRRVRIRFDET